MRKYGTLAIQLVAAAVAFAQYGREGVKGKLAVGLWAHRAPLDFDGDGRLDLVVGAEDGFFYYFERTFLEGAAK